MPARRPPSPSQRQRSRPRQAPRREALVATGPALYRPHARDATSCPGPASAACRAPASCRPADRVAQQVSHSLACTRSARARGAAAAGNAHQPLWSEKAQVSHRHGLFPGVPIHVPRLVRAPVRGPRRRVPRGAVVGIPPPFLPPHLGAGELEPIAALHVLDFFAALVPAPVDVPRAVRVGLCAAGPLRASARRRRSAAQRQRARRRRHAAERQQPR